MSEGTYKVKFDRKTIACPEGEPLGVCLYRNGIKSLNFSSKHLRCRGFTDLEWWMPERFQSQQDSFLNPYAVVDDGISVTIPRPGALHQFLIGTMGHMVDSQFPHKVIVRKRPFWSVARRLLRRDLPHPLPTPVQQQMIKQSVIETDALVVGSGVSGISFALKLRELGGKVAVIEAAHTLGGHAALDESTMQGLGKRLRDYAEGLVQRAQDEGVQLFTDLAFDGFFDDGALGVRLGGLQSDAPVFLRARFFVFATGLRDLPSLFENNDIPGHITASTALKLAGRYGVRLGDEGVVIGSNEYAVRTALQLKSTEVGVTLATRYEHLTGVRREYLAALKDAKIPVVAGVRKMSAIGKTRVRSLVVDEKRLQVDFIVSAESMSPTLELLGQAGVPVGYSRDLRSLIPMHGWNGETVNDRVLVVGRSSGILDEYASSAFAEATAYYVATKLKLGVKDEDVANKLNEAKSALSNRCQENYESYSRLVSSYEARGVLNDHGQKAIYSDDPHKVFVCFCEDITLSDILRAVTVHGFQDVEMVKRYTGVGTGKCQGKRCLANSVYVISDLTRKPPGTINVFRQRPMTVTTSLESLESAEL